MAEASAIRSDCQIVSAPPLLLLNGYAATEEDWDPTFLGALRERSALLTPDHRADSIDGMATRLIGLLFPPRVAKMIDQTFGEVVAAARARLDPGWLDAQERAIDAWHAEPGRERLSAIEAPAMVAWGSEDVVIPAANGPLLAQELPGAWACPFQGGGHAFMAQEPDRLAAAINAFLGR